MKTLESVSSATNQIVVDFFFFYLNDPRAGSLSNESAYTSLTEVHPDSGSGVRARRQR